jgi:hypothetical protein
MTDRGRLPLLDGRGLQQVDLVETGISTQD